MFDKGAIAPEDDWTFELIPEEILGLPAETAVSAEELDLSDIQDVVLSMEYDISPVYRSTLGVRERLYQRRKAMQTDMIR